MEDVKCRSTDWNEGFVIVPLKLLDEATAMDIVENRPMSVIKKKEILMMYTSSVIEISKGDNSQKSLNVKLYNCLADFAQAELDAITKRNLK